MRPATPVGSFDDNLLILTPLAPALALQQVLYELRTKSYFLPE
jgi:hypothetical protein